MPRPLPLVLLMAGVAGSTPQAKTLLLAIVPRGRGRETNDQANALVAKRADDTRVDFPNINDAFLDGDKSLSTELMPDALRPNEKGYAVGAERLHPTLKKLLAADAPK